MEEYFEKYKKAKFVLCKLVCQFYDCDINQGIAKKYNIEFTEKDIFNQQNKVTCVSHGYNPEGLYIWNKLGITEPLLTLRHMWEIMYAVEYELYDKNIDYHRESVEYKLIDLYLIEKYYKSSMSLTDAINNKVVYNKDIDVSDRSITGCYHLAESAGEEAWNLFKFDSDFVATSRIETLKQILKEQLLDKDFKKVRKM